MSFPSLKRRRFLDRELPFTCITAIPPIVGAIYAACTDPSKPAYVYLGSAIWFALAGVASAWRAHTKDKKIAAYESPERLVPALYTMHASALVLAGLSPMDQKHRRCLRITAHRVDPNGTEVEQVCDYVGGDPLEPSGEKKVGRRRSARCGVVGRAIQRSAPQYFRRENDDFAAYKLEMTRDFGMKSHEVDDLSAERLAHLAIPIADVEGVVIAVIFMDSSDRDFFTAALQEAVIGQAIGLARYLQVNYV